MTVRRALLTLLTALAAVGLWLSAPPARALPAPQAASCSGVWVVVDYGSLGGTSTSCATSFSTGTAALRAGFSPTLDNGMVVKINGIPVTVNTQDHYWSYWHATLQADGSYSAWAYSGLGANAYHPTAGSADGWRYQALSEGYVPPGVAPPKKVPATTAPATAAPAPTTAKAVTTKPATTATTVMQPSQSAPDSTTSSATTPEASVSGTPSSAATDVTVTVTAPPATTSPATAKASMVGALVVIAVLVVGSIGLAVWRKRRGRMG